MYCNSTLPIQERPECQMATEMRGLLDTVAGVRMVSSLLGIIGSSSILILAVMKKRVFNPEVHPIFMLSLADCMLAVLWISGGGLWLADPISYDNRWCYAVTLLTVILECVTINLTLVYAIFAFISTSKTDLNSVLTHVNRGVGWKPVAIVYFIAWFLPVILVMIVFATVNGFYHIIRKIESCTCWCMPTVINIIPLARTHDFTGIPELRHFIENQHSIIYGLGALIILNYIIVFVALLILYIKILRIIKKIRRKHDEIIFGPNRNSQYGTAESTRIVYGQSRARKRVVIFLTLFLFSGLCNILVTVLLMIFIDQHQKDSRHNKNRHSTLIAFLLAQGVTIGLQGFTNAIAYGWTRDDFVQVISVPLTNENPEPYQENDSQRKNELGISQDSHDTDLFTETIYTSNDSDID